MTKSKVLTPKQTVKYIQDRLNDKFSKENINVKKYKHDAEDELRSLEITHNSSTPKSDQIYHFVNKVFLMEIQNTTDKLIKDLNPDLDEYSDWDEDGWVFEINVVNINKNVVCDDGRDVYYHHIDEQELDQKDFYKNGKYQ